MIIQRRAVCAALPAVLRPVYPCQIALGIIPIHLVKLSGVGVSFPNNRPVRQPADVLAACREKGLLVLTAKTRLRLLPPLTLTAHDVDMALEVLAEVLGAMEPTAPKEQA